MLLWGMDFNEEEIVSWENRGRTLPGIVLV